MANQGKPAASYKFNSLQEIKSHSSILFNERMAYLFYLLDLHAIEMNSSYDIQKIQQVRAILRQIYKNFRMLIRFNPTMRVTLNLETKDPGIYIPDVVLGRIDRMVEYCETRGYTTKTVYIIIQEINIFEMMLKDILQYFHYFIRPDFRQKPDVEVATESYKQMADARTVDELKAIVGKSHHIDFDNLGIAKIEEQIKSSAPTDEDADSKMTRYDDEDVDEDEEEEYLK